MRRVHELSGALTHGTLGFSAGARLRARAAVAVAISSLSIMALPACSQDDRVGSTLELENVESVTRALDAPSGGFGYASQCQANGVPSPVPFGANYMGTGNGKWTNRGAMTDSYVAGPSPVTIFTMTSSSPPGTCAIAVRHFPHVFDVLCQGTNGMACFWEAEENWFAGHPSISPLPPEIPANELTIVGLVPAAPDQANKCTTCHAGGNAFITHMKPDNHPTKQITLPGWTTASLSNPIVPTTWTQNGGTPSTTGYASACTGCHSSGSGASRFPLLRNPEFAGENFCMLLRTVASRPASQGGMPFNAPVDCIPGNNCPIDNDPAVQAMIAACGVPLKPTSMPAQTLINGISSPTGAGVSQLSTKMHVSAHAMGIHQHYFMNATTTMPNPGCCTPHQNPHPSLVSNDTINIWVYMPTDDKPREIMIQLLLDNGQWQRAYWGEDLIPWSPRTRIGGLPAAGSWQSLVFHPGDLGFPGGKFTGIAYTLFNGSAYWADTLFRQAASPYLNQYVSQVWVKDAVPAGAGAYMDGGDDWSFVSP